MARSISHESSGGPGPIVGSTGPTSVERYQGVPPTAAADTNGTSQHTAPAGAPGRPPQSKAQARGVHAVDWTVLREIRESLEGQCGGEASEVDDDEQQVSLQELTACWLEVASLVQKRQGGGQLTARDREFIEVRVAQSMREVDPKNTNLVDRDEWVHHMLLTRSSPRTMKAMLQINTLLDSALDQCPGILVGLQHGLEVAHQAVVERRRGKSDEHPTVADSDSAPSRGKLTVQEVLNVFGRKLWHFRPQLAPAHKGTSGFAARSADDFVTETIKALELEAYSQITYADFLSLCLGRRERQVCLHLYDLSRGAASALSPWLIEERVQGVWHTGIVAFGKEYYFGGDIYYDVPSQTGFGKPARVVMLGYTLRQREELHAFIVDELKPVFSREAYDAARNNCNHFTDRLSMYLVGKHIPEEVLRQPELLVNTKLGQTLRPMLNRWLGFYFEPHSSAEEVVAMEMRGARALGALSDVEGRDWELGPATDATIKL